MSAPIRLQDESLTMRVAGSGRKPLGVFSPARAAAARDVLLGGSSVRGSDEEWDCELRVGWTAAVLDVASEHCSSDELERLIDATLGESPALGIREYGQQRRLRLAILFPDRTASRAERMAFIQTRHLVQMLAGQGLWAAVGLGTAGGPREVNESLLAARLALGYALARGPGIYSYREDQEVAGLTCSGLGLYRDQFVARIQSGVPWEDLVAPVFACLKTCSSARRLEHEIQRLFSGIADLVPASARVERFYHISDFVLGPDELRSELEALCRWAVETVRVGGRSLADRKLAEFREYIAQHYGDWRLDLAIVCSALQISPSYLSKILRRSLKMTYVDYVTEVRLTRSRELLSGTDWLTSQIAERVGYVYTHYFSATFKKRYGTTPSEFRQSHRANVASAV